MAAVLTPESLARVQQKIDAFAAKANRFGLTPPRLLCTPVEWVVWEDMANGNRSAHPPQIDLIPRYRRVGTTTRFECQVVGDAPVVQGYTFLGRVEHLAEGNILAAAPGQEIPAEYRQAAPLCRQCFTVRRRLDTFVLRCDATGETVQVGRNCLADYLRDAGTAEALLDWAAWHQGIERTLGEEAERTGGRIEVRVPVETIIRHAVVFTGLHGWVSAAVARDRGVPSSARKIGDWLYLPRFGDKTPEWLTPDYQARLDAAETTELVDTVLAWVNTDLAGRDDAHLTNYEANLVVAFRQGSITGQHVGLVASAVGAFYRVRDQIREEARKAAEKAANRPIGGGGHLGQVGERLALKVHVDRINGPYPGEYGDSYMVLMTTDGGHKLVWWTGESLTLEADTDYYIKATVKKHGEFNGEPQTQVSRATEITEEDYVKAITPKKPRGKRAASSEL